MRTQTLLLIAITPAFASQVAADQYVVAQEHPGASDENPGTAERPFRTISAAAEVAGPGDAVTIRAGVYRESVVLTRGGEPGRPVVYQAAQGEDVLKAISSSE